jgi:adenylate kinase
MNILLLGAPGSGKGSQSELLIKEFGLVQISTGELLRKAISERTEEGLRAEKFVGKGELVPDELVADIISRRLEKKDCEKGVIFDGYPRNISQAEVLSAILEKQGKKLDIVFNIESPFDVLTKRLLSRRSCAVCGKGYNLITDPPKNNSCGICGGKIISRDDDREDVIKNRLEVYLKSTKPLADYYSSKNMLENIDGNRTIGEIYGDLKRILNIRAGKR